MILKRNLLGLSEENIEFETPEIYEKTGVYKIKMSKNIHLFLNVYKNQKNISIEKYFIPYFKTVTIENI